MSSQTKSDTRYIDTRDMSREQWLEARRGGLGGSDIAAIMGLHDFKTPYDVWLDKTGRETEDIDNHLMRFGRDIEPAIAKWFEEDTGYKAQRDNMMWIHPEHDFLRANIDRTILKNGDHSGNGVLECKSTSFWRWKNVEDEVPPSWYLQMQDYMMIKGYSWGAIAALVDRKNEYLFFDADPEIHELIVNEAGEWWYKHILNDEPPKPVLGDDLAKVYSKIDKAKTIEATPEVEEAVKRVQGLTKQKKEIEQALDEEKFKIESFIGEQEAKVLNSAGEKLCSRAIVQFWKPDKNSLKDKYPDVAADEDIQNWIKFSRLYM